MFFLLSSPCLLLVFSVSIRRGVIGSRQGAGREQTGSRQGADGMSGTNLLFQKDVLMTQIEI